VEICLELHCYEDLRRIYMDEFAGKAAHVQRQDKAARCFILIEYPAAYR
jgi:hypothetical protein